MALVLPALLCLASGLALVCTGWPRRGPVWREGFSPLLPWSHPDYPLLLPAAAAAFLEFSRSRQPGGSRGYWGCLYLQHGARTGGDDLD